MTSRFKRGERAAIEAATDKTVVVDFDHGKELTFGELAQEHYNSCHEDPDCDHYSHAPHNGRKMSKKDAREYARADLYNFPFYVKGFEPPQPPKPLSMDKLVAAIVAAGFPAEVSHTGGGVATIYAGEYDAEDRCKLVVGPGYFERDHTAWLDLSDAGYGPDVESGEGFKMLRAPMTTEKAAKILVAFLKASK